MFVCVCNAVSEGQIKDLIRSGVRNLDGVKQACAAGNDCGMCVHKIEKMFRKDGSPAEDAAQNRHAYSCCAK